MKDNSDDSGDHVFAELAKTLVAALLLLAALASRPPRGGCATGAYALLFFVALPLCVPATGMLLRDIGVVCESNATRAARVFVCCRALLTVSGLGALVVQLLLF